MVTYGKLTDLVEKRNTLDINQGLYFVISQNETKQFILDLNRIEQLFKKGVGLDEQVLGYYTRVTELLNTGSSFTYKGNSKTKKAGEPYFLYDTGEMFDSFTVKVNQDSFIIDAYTIKDGDDLEANLGPFVGLTEESIELLVNYLVEPIVKWLVDTLIT